MAKRDICIEPHAGATYASDEFGVYEYSVYPRYSVLAGQTRRRLMDVFPTVVQAQREYPEATVCEGSGYAPPSLDHLPDDGDY